MSVHKLDIVSQKLILTPKLQLMTTMWKYLVTILLEKITHLTLNMYYKDTLPFKLSNIKYLQECITFEIIIGIKCCKFLVSL